MHPRMAWICPDDAMAEVDPRHAWMPYCPVDALGYAAGLCEPAFGPSTASST
ncbi:hypothetical protein SRABI35_00685 [Stenotrophomonas lactitubi]|nr:hypothetical protein SRABI35_00685 [Stenotrophomonas lactitubi]